MLQDPVKTPEELSAICAKMQGASNTFYRMATQTGCHTFIEVTGFINEFIKVCSNAAKRGIDFTCASTHSGTALPLFDHEAAYLGEKFGCIFDTSLGRDPEKLAIFLRKAFDEDIVVALAKHVLKDQGSCVTSGAGAGTSTRTSATGSTSVRSRAPRPASAPATGRKRARSKK